MLAVNQFQDSLIDGPGSALLEIHRSTISLHHAKTNYSYPTIRLPHTFSKLAGLRTHIYQTVHKRALAFLVVIAPTSASDSGDRRCENDAACSKAPALTWRRSLANPARARIVTLRSLVSPLAEFRVVLDFVHHIASACVNRHRIRSLT
jgi:hypothetical protein